MRSGWWVSAILGLCGVLGAGFLYGHEATKHNWFPVPQVVSARHTAHLLKSQLTGRLSFPYIPSNEKRTVVIHDAAAMAPGLTLITGVGAKGAVFAKLVAPDGAVAHQWDLGVFRLWPNPDHLPEEERPKQAPGSHAHGMVLLENGDLTFNYEGIGMVQVDFCGRLKWRLAERANHDIFRDDAGNFWAPSFKTMDKGPAYAWAAKTPVNDDYIIKVSPDGKLLREISVADLLVRNGQFGLFRAGYSYRAYSRTDLLHQNAIDFFPKDMAPGAYGPGDVLLSLRNANAIIVFNLDTLIIKDVLFGPFTYQHDPHFEDGSSISVFDNNYAGPPDSGTPELVLRNAYTKSRIIIVSANKVVPRVVFEGTPEQPFYSALMGKQQPLANGNRLLTESLGGRALEIDPKGAIVWEYFNPADPGYVGALVSADRISPDMMSPSKLEGLKAQCAKQ